MGYGDTAADRQTATMTGAESLATVDGRVPYRTKKRHQEFPGVVNKGRRVQMAETRAILLQAGMFGDFDNYMRSARR